MTDAHLHTFVERAAERSRTLREPADCVLAIAPLMFDLLEAGTTFLQPEHYRSSAKGYTRNLIYEAPDDTLALYSIVWLPGQWTPVHDHGSWGIVGVVEGVLEERSYVRGSADRGSDADIDLLRGGTIMLRHGAVTSFVPNPDHIHMTGVPPERPRAVSLHLYGRMMSDFNVYDVEGRTRRRINVAHNES